MLTLVSSIFKYEKQKITCKGTFLSFISHHIVLIISQIKYIPSTTIWKNVLESEWAVCKRSRCLSWENLPK